MRLPSQVTVYPKPTRRQSCYDDPSTAIAKIGAAARSRSSSSERPKRRSMPLGLGARLTLYDRPTISPRRTSQRPQYDIQREPWQPGDGEASEAAGNTESQIMLIEPDGNLVLQLLDQGGGTVVTRYRVSSEKLQKGSRYFDAMLAPGKFSEGAAIRSTLESLKQRYGGELDKAPASELPAVSFPEIEQLEVSETTVKAMDMLLLLMHGYDDFAEKRTVKFLVHLTVLAEQVLAVEVGESYVRRYIAKFKQNPSFCTLSKEEKEKIRQLIYLGYVYEDKQFFMRFTNLLIEYGPDSYADDTGDLPGTWKSLEASDTDTVAPWMRLPHDIEGKKSQFFPLNLPLKGP